MTMMRLFLALSAYASLVAALHRAPHTAHSTTKQPELLVLVRGCAFHYNLHRFSLTNARRLDRRIEQEQLDAIRSIELGVLEPLRTQGWQPHIAFDVTNCSWPVKADGVSGDGASRLRSEASRLRAATGSTGGGFRIRAEGGGVFRSGQVGGLLDSLDWAVEEQQRERFAAILVLRLDMRFKKQLPLPSPAETSVSPVVRVFSATWQRDDTLRPGGTLRANDVIFWLPGQDALAAFKAALVRLTELKLVNDLHEISRTLDVGTFFFSQYDSDSQNDWNPVYTLIGRAAPKGTKQDRIRFVRAAAEASPTLDWGAALIPGFHEPSHKLLHEEGLQGIDGEHTLRMEVSLPMRAPLSPFHSDAGVAVTACEFRLLSLRTNHLLRVTLDQPLDAHRVEVQWVNLTSSAVGSILTMRAPILSDGHGGHCLHTRRAKRALREDHATAPENGPQRLLNDQVHEPNVTAYLAKSINDQLVPFRGGISAEMVQRAYDSPRVRIAYKGDDYIRLRIVNNSLYVAKRGRCVHGRHTSVLQGLLRILEEDRVPDVDIVWSVSDSPPCDVLSHRSYPTSIDDVGDAKRSEPLPIASFSRRAKCHDLLMPCWSMLHDGYQEASSTHPYSYAKLVSLRHHLPFKQRRRELWWDMAQNDSSARSRTLARLHKSFPQLPLAFPSGKANIEFNPSVAAVNGPAEAAGYQFGAHMEGVTYSMRLKNVLLAGSLAVWLDRPPADMVYQEYWHGLLEPLDDSIWVLNTHTAAITEHPTPSQQRARRMADRAASLTAQILKPLAIRQYVRALLASYAQLQTFSPAAMPLAGFVHVTRGALERYCGCGGGDCFDNYLRLWSSQGTEPPKMSSRPLVAPRPRLDCMNTSIKHDANVSTLLHKWCFCRVRSASDKTWPRGVCSGRGKRDSGDAG